MDEMLRVEAIAAAEADAVAKGLCIRDDDHEQ